MDIVLVRHAEPVRVDASESGGEPADPQLTARGHAQAERLAEWLRHEQFDALLVSPKRRAIETAAPIIVTTKLTPIIDESLIEYDRSSDHYIPMEELRANKDPRFAAMIEGRWEEFGGEAPEIFRARITAALDRIVGEYAGKRVLAVCHGGVINVALAIVAQLDRQLWFSPEYTSISRVVASRGGVRSVVSVNESAHLFARRD